MKSMQALSPAIRPYLWGAAALLAIGVVWLFIGSQTRHTTIQPASTSKGTLNNDAGNVRNCSGNPADRCVMAPSVDLFPAGSEAATNPSLISDSTAIYKQIGGRIEAVDDTTLTLRTTSGRLFRVSFPNNVVTWWNTEISPNYGKYQLGIGDELRIDYLEPATHSETTVAARQIITSALAIDPKTVNDTRIGRYPEQ